MLAACIPAWSMPLVAMTTTDPEIRAEVQRIKASEKEAKILDAAFDKGRFAFISGMTRDGCLPVGMPGNADGWNLSGRGQSMIRSKP